MAMPSSDIATVRALRSDVALQIARYAHRTGATQVVTARQLSLPQPTLSKIINGHVSDVSLELLIRVAVRAGLAMTLQTGRVPQEAGAFRSATPAVSSRAFRSRLGVAARQSVIRSDRRLTPSQRLQSFLEHNQLMSALHRAGRAAEAQRVRKALPEP
jgi:predicted XRE-type DNA-binding protein